MENFKDMIRELNSTNSRLEKEAILDKYKDKKGVQYFLQQTYDPEIKFGVTRKGCLDSERIGNLLIQHNLSIEELLEKLSNREITGDNAIGYINYIAEKLKAEEIYRIIDKDLNCGISISTINKVIPGCIKSVKIPLAERMDKIKRSALKPGSWFLSEKIDGQRMLTMIINEEVKFYARSGDRMGKEIKTLEKLKPEIKEFYNIFNLDRGLILDGEVIIEKRGNTNTENCRLTASTMRRGSRDSPEQVKLVESEEQELRYYVFDCYIKEDFFTESGKAVYSKRTSVLKNEKSIRFIKVLEQKQIIIKDISELEELFNRPIPEGSEGFILRRDCEYRGKRSMDMIKIKKKDRIELTVYDLEETKKAMLDGKATMEEVDCVGALFCRGLNEDGDEVLTKVGIGLSDKERIDFYKDRKLILGKVVTVEYSEISQNKAGSKSLRSPIFICIRENNE